MADMFQIMAKLKDRTSDGLIVWKEIGTGTSFAAIVGSMSVLMSQRETARSLITRIDILDEKGRKIDYLESEQSSCPELHELYESARRTALSVNDRLEEFLKALDSP